MIESCKITRCAYLVTMTSLYFGVKSGYVRVHQEEGQELGPFKEEKLCYSERRTHKDSRRESKGISRGYLQHQ